VQAQEIVQEQAIQTQQAQASATVEALTAVPQQATQQAALMQEYAREQQAFVSQVVTPLIPIVAALVLCMLILIVVLIYPQAMPWLRRQRSDRYNVYRGRAYTINGKARDYSSPSPRPQAPPSGLMAANPIPSAPAGVASVHVEILDAAEPPVAHWVADAEHQLSVEDKK
jgi:hypothetical protein